MVEKQRTRVEEAMTNMVNEVDKLYLRKMQVSNFSQCLVFEEGFV
jgi:hypothetical protein